ncbi:hypothetical protein NQZ68_000795 [Dissostichus eleginoides]|nr:hypothetical protein NQZ68_000795 [Dissostichus eleginoides]
MVMPTSDVSTLSSSSSHLQEILKQGSSHRSPALHTLHQPPCKKQLRRRLKLNIQDVQRRMSTADQTKRKDDNGRRAGVVFWGLGRTPLCVFGS